jgi:Ca2+-transporting ATPase
VISELPKPAFASSVEEVAVGLGTDPVAGLAEEEAARRRREAGPNELPAEKGSSAWTILLSQFANVLILILVVAIVLSAALGHAIEAAAIGAIAIFSVVLGFLQESRAARALDALRRLASPDATVIRSGRERDLPSRDVVPGDLVVLADGDIVPADGRLVEASNLRFDEAALTGESSPVGKHAKPIPDGVALGDRKNMVFASTAVTHGRGRAIVVATGAATEVGRIGAMVRDVRPSPTPLEENLRRVGRVLAWSAVAIVAGVAGLGLLQGRPFLDMIVFGIALAVAVVPEALPAVVTISLALGARRMVKRHALIRRLPTVETLGSVTVICTDKTGTLTTGEMTVREIYAAGKRLIVTGAGYEPKGAFLADGAEIRPQGPWLQFLEAATLSTDARLVEDPADKRWKVRGDPTEGALLVMAAKAGTWKAAVESRHPRTGEIAFSSERKRMTTVHEGPEGRFSVSKGAPEVILENCARVRTADGEEPLDDAGRKRILSVARDMGSRALRVLAVARRAGGGTNEAEAGMTFLGLAGMIDPPRPGVRAAIETCFAAGIRPVMITGDHPLTAKAIGRELGLLRHERVMTGPELETATGADLARSADDVDVYARVSPAHKLRIVEAFQGRGDVAAMTGDGVNDAPALKKADVGVAMGIAGTDVAKGAAAMILTDDNFESIVAAVEEGRAVFDNIKKYLMYLLSSNVGEIVLMAAAVALGLPMPLTAVQILYVNLATDGLPALALALDPPAPDLMRRRPRKAGAGILVKPVIALIVAGGLWSAVVNVSLFAWALQSGRPLVEAVTMVFVSLVLIQFFKAYSFRSERRPILVRPFANPWLNLAVAWELGLLMLVLYVPFLERAFGTYPISATDWLILAGAALTIVPVLEIAKWMVRRGWWGERE